MGGGRASPRRGRAARRAGGLGTYPGSGAPAPGRPQLAAAAESVVLNLCEGTGRTGGSCRNHLEIAFGSAAECHGALSLCKAYGVPGADDAL
ncbi:MAG: four helix bundle protein, partial [Planctomycetes bacterium]|nr:four helix bundle protein [Planctomycetota bacterium]